MTVTDFLFILLASTPSLLFWIAVIVLGIIMLRRGGGRPERFLITGGSLKIIAILLTALSPFYLFGRIENTEEIVSVFHWMQILTSIIHAAGITCLIYAFWVKFNSKMNHRGNMALPQH